MVVVVIGAAVIGNRGDDGGGGDGGGGDGISNAERTVGYWCADARVPSGVSCTQAYIRSHRDEITDWCLDVAGLPDDRAVAQQCVDLYFESMD